MVEENLVKDDKLLFQLAKQFVVLEDILEDERSNEFEIEEAKKEMNKMFKLLLRNYYDIDKFNHYQKLYREMTIEDYYIFLKGLEQGSK